MHMKSRRSRRKYNKKIGARIFLAAIVIFFGFGMSELMKILARACGYQDLQDFTINDLTTWEREISYLTGIKYAGVGLS